VEIADKVARVRKVLDSATMPIIFRVSESSKPKSEPVWHLRHCYMQADQRSKYDDCCTEVRGALSTCLETTPDQPNQSLKAVSSALLRLRQHCFHSDAVERVVSDRTRSGYGYNGSSRDAASMVARVEQVDSPAQTDATLASYLIKGSAKLRELVSVLKLECGYDLLGDDVVGPLLDRGRKETTENGSRKVAILATLCSTTMRRSPK
jgi:hypothetical protein